MANGETRAMGGEAPGGDGAAGGVRAGAGGPAGRSAGAGTGTADPHDVLRDVFGHEGFRPGQERVIEAVLRGDDCIAVMPTGAGKSLTFQIPAKIMAGTVLVVSPLISLMKDQVDSLRGLGYRATAINSTLEFEERRRRLTGFRRGEYELVYLAPEALDGSLREFVRGCPLSLLVVDEAHCISAWGHDFRPSYRRLQGLKRELDDIPVLALTATATRAVARDILRQLGMVKPDGYKGSFFRPNLRIRCRKKGRGTTRRELLALVRERSGQSGIVYCLARKTVERTSAFLATNNVRSLPYHAGLSDEEREAHQDAFLRGETDVIVATVAFGMGIDKPDVRFVIHQDMPKDVESWYQQIGRAGRDGQPSDCFLFYSWADVKMHERFLDEIDDPELRRAKNQSTVNLFRLVDGGGCRHKAIVAYFDERIDACGDACDVCTGVSVQEMAREAGADIRPGRGRRGRRSGGESSRSVPPEVRQPITDPASKALLDRLKTLRKELADEQEVPAYVVFSNKTLRELVVRRPATHEEMLDVSGVGPVKLERYGDIFLEALAAGG